MSIVEKQIKHSFDTLKENILAVDFPEGYRDGLYFQALDQLQMLEEEKIKLKDIYKNKKSAVMVALKYFNRDYDLYRNAQRIKKNAEQSKIHNEKLAQEGEDD